MELIRKRIKHLRDKGINELNDIERSEFIKKIEMLSNHEKNNPKIDANDPYYNESLILLVHEKSNWHLYCNKDKTYVYSIAVVPSAQSSSFGRIEYFKRWFNYVKKNRGSDMEKHLTNEAKEILFN